MMVRHQTFHKLDADVTGGLEPERGNPMRKVQIVVDGLGHMHHLEPTGRPLLHLQCGKGCVVSSYRDQPRHAEFVQSRQTGIEALGFLCGIRTRCPKVGTTAEVNAADGLDRQGPDLARIALHDPFETVPDADHVAAAENAADRGGADHAVDARRRCAPDNNRYDRSLLPHASLLSLTRRRIRSDTSTWLTPSRNRPSNRSPSRSARKS